MNLISGFTKQALKDFFSEKNIPSFRADQILDWYYRKGILSFDEMTNLSLDFRVELSEWFTPYSIKCVKKTPSSDGETIKYLWQLPQGDLVESVLILAPDRRTVCVSSQVGCPAKCAFCASGKMGFFRNLTKEEIIEQVLYIHAELLPQGEKVTNIVYMGMGEPLENYEAVVDSIRAFSDPDLLALSQRRITVSTVGVIEGINRLADEEGIKVNLVLSLHAPNQKIRQKIIPYARKYPLEDILYAMENYSAVTKRDITYEYTLLEGINDKEENAEELVDLLRGRQCTVNLIPYNPVLGLKLQRPSRQAIQAFRHILTSARIVNTCRYTKGDDIAAACGQLALTTSIPMATS